MWKDLGFSLLVAAWIISIFQGNWFAVIYVALATLILVDE